MQNHGLNGELQEILTKSAVDRSFREGLLNDPRATLQKTFGRSFPPNLRIKFVPKDPDCDVMFVLPDPLVDDDELAHDDLDTVSGGQGQDSSQPVGGNDIWQWGDQQPPKDPD